MLRIHKIFEPELAKVTQRKAIAQIGTRERRGGVGDKDLPAVASGSHASGAVHIDADVVSARVQSRRAAFAGMHPHPHPDRRAVREGRRAERPLRGCGRSHCLYRDAENDEERIPLDPNFEPAVFERVAEDARMRFEHVLVAVGAELGLELGRALDVGE